MVLGLVMYVLLKRKYLGDIGEVPARLVRDPNVAQGQSTAERAEKPRLTREERHRVLALFIIAFFVIFFWAAFEQAGSSMNIFALERTERTV
jgi:POT family proton-dependent oligopeptide transporter